MEFAFARGSIQQVISNLDQRLTQIDNELGWGAFEVPVALVLVLPAKYGGNNVADEVIRRFHSLDWDSAEAIDFYYVGWEVETWSRSETNTDELPDPSFNHRNFKQSTSALEAVGITGFSGNADLILVDAEYDREKGSRLRFDEAMRLDLTRAAAADHLTGVGEILTAIVSTAKDMKEPRMLGSISPTATISDQLGLLVSSRSVMGWLWDKLGGVIGAKSLAQVATRRVGPAVTLEQLYNAIP